MKLHSTNKTEEESLLADAPVSVLIVDDNEIDRASVKRFIKQENLPYQVAEAGSVEEALGKIAINPNYDLILLDYLLDDGTGFEVLREVSEKIPCIFVTGNGDEKVASEAMKKGAYDYLIKDNAGNYLNMISVTFNNVLKRKLAERALEDKTLALENSNKELEHFAYIASHDLNEPLRTITSFVQILEKKYGDQLDENAQEYMDLINSGCTRMRNLIDSLLQYSRVCHKHNDIQDVDLNKTIEEVVLSLSFKIEETQSKINLNNKLPVISASAMQIMQLFQNLISNGMKFNENQPIINISCTEDDKYFKFSVSDNGIGIDQDDVERIFQVFQRLHTADEYPGTGIGLSLCKKIVENHGGEIWLESEKGKGTTFYFTVVKNVGI